MKLMHSMKIDLDDGRKIPVAQLVESFLASEKPKMPEQPEMSEQETDAQKDKGADEPNKDKSLSEIYVRGSGITSFADLTAAEAVEESSYEIRELTHQYQSLTWNIMGDSTITDKPAALRSLTEEFITLLEAEMDSIEETGDTTVEPDASATAEEPNLTLSEGEVHLVEDASGSVIDIWESELPANGSRSPIDMDVILIQPGYGNKKDKHFYPAAMLERDAPRVFKGIKMYATDHRPDQKSVRTEVSRIKEITGFASGLEGIADGSPIAKVTVFDPSFAEMVRNRAVAGELSSLECSILASGKVKEQEVNGQTTKVVESITAASSVDWVSSAGAGGRALNISEKELSSAGAGGRALNISENEEDDMEDQTKAKDTEAKTDQTAPESLPAGTPEPAQESDKGTQVKEKEGKIVALSEQQVTALIGDKLPAPAAAFLTEREFKSTDEVKGAIGELQKMVKELTGSGETRGHGAGEQPEAPKPFTNLELQEKFDRIDARHGLTVPIAEGG